MRGGFAAHQVNAGKGSKQAASFGGNGVSIRRHRQRKASANAAREESEAVSNQAFTSAGRWSRSSNAKRATA